jgi:hypothetical protein
MVADVLKSRAKPIEGANQDVTKGHGARLEALGPHLFVAFPVRALKNARVLWINNRWFIEAGIDCLNLAVREQIVAWLLEDFAVDAVAESGAAQSGVLFADRYGASDGAAHGGSGRCGAKGVFNAKGIGRTPLASPHVDFAHAHGCMSLAEAMREVVNSEIAAAEMPYGAVPIIAVIDAGMEFRSTPQGTPERRGIVVRPNALRPAHFERSILFGDAGSSNSAQYLDALRTRDAIRAVTREAALGETNCAFEDLSLMFTKFAAQIGFARAHRLWQGRFLSSNVSVDGALLDFGSFRSVPSWRRAIGEPGEAFGGEESDFLPMIYAQCFYFKKFAPPAHALREPKDLFSNVVRQLREAFAEGCIEAMFGGQEVAPDLRAAASGELLAYFAAQQRETIQVGYAKSSWRRPWLYDALVDESGAASTMAERVAVKLRAILEQAHRRADGAGMVTARLDATRRWLKPRPLLYYETAVPLAKAVCDRLTGELDHDRARIESYVRNAVAKSRRYWRRLPAHFIVHGQRTDLVSSVLYCHDVRRDESTLWVECREVGGSLHILGTNVRSSAAELYAPTREGAVVRFAVPVQGADFDADNVTTSMGEHKVPIPPPAYRYAFRRAQSGTLA